MNSEIKRLEMRIKFGGGDEELDLIQSAALRDLMNAYESQITTLTAERDAARKELAALKSAPGMDEVETEREGCYDGADHSHSSSSSIENLADIARCSIASREEVVGLLRWIKSKLTQDRLDDLRFIDTDKYCRILEIVEGE